MENEVYYTLETDDEDRRITIYPANHMLASGNKIAKGVYNLREGKTDMGDIVFDDNMNQWEYTGMGNLTHEQATRIALFIKSNNQLLNK